MPHRPSIIDAYVKLLGQLVIESPHSKKRIAGLAGVHQNSLSAVDTSDWAPSLSTMRALEGTILSTADQSQAIVMLESIGRRAVARAEFEKAADD